MLEVRQLSVAYGRHRALENASVHVDKGEIVVILGANGAGKSSLLKAISGISEGKVAGSISLGGVDLAALKPDRIVESGIALVPEGRGIFAELTVAENLALGAYGERARDEENINLERVHALFPKLKERRKQVVRTMSGGEQQMVAIGRAMMSNPEILMLDEPSLGLSPILCRDLFQSLAAVRNSGIGILLVEQNAKQSLAIADRGYVLENGTIVKEATATALMDNPAVRKAYLGAAGAAAPTTGRPSAPLERKEPAAPVVIAAAASAPRPVPPGSPSPMDIATAAMVQYSPRSVTASATDRKRAPTAGISPPGKPAAPVRQSRPPEPPPPRPAGLNGASAATAGMPHDIDIAQLVGAANARSAANFDRSRRQNGTASGSVSPERRTAEKSENMPDLKSGSDRLSAVLAEIEAAAAKARNYKPPGRKA